MRIERARFQFGVVLHADEPGMIRNLHRLRQQAVRRQARQDNARFRELVRPADVHLVAVAMALLDFRGAVDFRDLRAFSGVRAG